MSITRNVVILGEDGSGKRTLGNRIVGGDNFEHETALGTGVHYREVERGDKFYRILTIDTGSLQTGYNNPVPHIQHQFQQIHLIIFAIPHGRYTDESHGSFMHAVESLHLQAKSISALVITHCETKTDKKRKAIMAKFTDDTQVAAFMQRGTYAVGFPDLSTPPPGGKPIPHNAIDRDEKAIRKLVERCDAPLSTKSLSISRNVVILGKAGSGKRTLGNHIVGRDIIQYKAALSAENVGAYYGEVRAGCMFYRILTVDTEVLQPGYHNPIPDIERKFQEIHSIIFTIRHSCNTDESHGSLMHAVEGFHCQAKSVSSLVITHCEGMTDKQQQSVISEFSTDARSSQVVAFMQHGTYAVGFPDLSTVPPKVKPILQITINRDEEAVGKLVDRCDIPLSTKSLAVSLRNVVILGKAGSGKRTLGNHIVGRDVFERETALDTGNGGTNYAEIRTGDTFYRILTVATERLQTGYNNPIGLKFQEIHSIIFTIPYGHNTDEGHGSLKHAVESFHQRARSVSSLVITHCETMTDEKREAIIAKFRDDAHSSQVVAFMQCGTHTVGFPDLSTLPLDGKPILQNTIDRDKEDIRKVVERCEVPLSMESLSISRNVVILGKVGSGKRTLGYHIVGRDIFPHEAALGTGNAGAHYGEVRIGCTIYRILTVDTENHQPSYHNPMPDIEGKFQEIHSIIFAIPHGHNTDEHHVSLMHAVESFHEQTKSISALVVTQCETMTDKQRKDIIAEFSSSQVGAFMQHGIHAVGFPDLSALPSDGKPTLQDAIDRDEEAIRKLVEQCDIPLSTESLSTTRNVVILGKVGSGKRTLGNHIVGGDIFPHETALGTGNVGAHYEEVRIRDTFYRILTVDTESLETGYYNPIPDIQKKFQEIHLIIFTIAHGRYTDESHKSLMHAVKSLHQKLKSISALVITHCEGMTVEQRGAIIAEFGEDARSSQVAAFMQHRIHAVGFPEISSLPPSIKPILQDTIDKDEKAIRELVKRCDAPLSARSLGVDIQFVRDSATDAIAKRAKEKQSNNCNIL